MALPTYPMQYVDPLLSNIASNWIIGDEIYAAQRIFPVVQTPVIAGLIAQYDRKDLYRVHDVRPRAPGVESQGGGYRTEHDEHYQCKEWAHHKDIADEDRAVAMLPFQPDRDATNYVTQLLMLKRDYLLAQAAFGVGIWGTDVTGIVGATNYAANNVRQWSDYVTPSNPQADIDYYRRVMTLGTGGFKPNVLAVTEDVWDALKNHPLIVARYIQTAPGGVPNLTKAQVAAVLELDDIVVCGSVANYGPEAGNWVGQWIFGSGSALLLHKTAAPSTTNPSAGYTFGFTGAEHQGMMVQIERFRLANDAKGDRITGNFHIDVKIQENVLGVYFNTIVGAGFGPAQVVLP